MKNEKSKFRVVRMSKCQSFGSQKGSNNREIRPFFREKKTATIPTYVNVPTHEKIGRKVVNVTQVYGLKTFFPEKKRYKNWFTDFYD